MKTHIKDSAPFRAQTIHANLHKVTAALLASITILSCDKLLLPKQDGQIKLAFIEEYYLPTRAASGSIPDTNKFILEIIDSKGRPLYSGNYGAAPESIIASPGTYSVKVSSCEFRTPAFDSPQWGDNQTVTVKSGEATSVQLICRQLNSGIRLKVAPQFLTAYPGGSLHLKAKDGKLLYSYSEKRTAYFNPGQISLILSDSGTDKTLLTRDLAPRDILTINISVSTAKEVSGGKINIQVDTLRNYLSEDYKIGESGSGSNGNALSVVQAREMAGTDDVWVYGYIVGGDLSSSAASFKPPFSSRTNIVIATRSTVTDRTGCMSVQLQKGEIRDALNLVDNPENLGRTVFLKGDIVESYYGLPGIQNLTDFKLE